MKASKPKPAKGKKKGKQRRFTEGTKQVKAEIEAGAVLKFHPKSIAEVLGVVEEPLPEPEDQPVLMGRPPKYDPRFCEIARTMSAMGATDQELAEAFKVDVFTIRRWQVTHADFCSAVKVGTTECDERVVRSLYQRAVGYSYAATKIMQYEGSPIRVDYVEHIAPDIGAAKHWLHNRRKTDWNPEQTNVNLSGTVKTDSDGSVAELARWVAYTLEKGVREKDG